MKTKELDPSVIEAYEKGYKDGYGKGRVKAYEKFYRDHMEGFKDDYRIRLTEINNVPLEDEDFLEDEYYMGLIRGLQEGSDEGYDQGYCNGHNQGYKSGYVEGEKKGNLHWRGVIFECLENSKATEYVDKSELIDLLNDSEPTDTF